MFHHWFSCSNVFHYCAFSIPLYYFILNACGQNRARARVRCNCSDIFPRTAIIIKSLKTNMVKKLGHALVLYGYRVGDMWLVCVRARFDEYVQQQYDYYLLAFIYYLLLFAFVRSFVQNNDNLSAAHTGPATKCNARNYWPEHYHFHSFSSTVGFRLRRVLCNRRKLFWCFLSEYLYTDYILIQEGEQIFSLALLPHPFGLEMYLVQNHKFSKFIDLIKNVRIDIFYFGFPLPNSENELRSYTRIRRVVMISFLISLKMCEPKLKWHLKHTQKFLLDFWHQIRNGDGKKLRSWDFQSNRINFKILHQISVVKKWWRRVPPPENIVHY